MKNGDRSALRRPATALLVAAAAFACLQAAAVAHYAADPWAWRDPLYADKAGRALAARPRVLALGSSRTVFGLKAGDLPGPAFNFGVAAGGPVTQAIYRRRLHAAGVRERVLVVEVMPAFLAEMAGGALPESLWLSGRRLSAEEREWAGDLGWRDAAPPAGGWLPVVDFRSGLLARIAPGWVPAELRQDTHRSADAAGWVPAPEVPRDEVARERAREATRRQYAGLSGACRLHAGAVAAFRGLLADARSEGVTPVLLLMPEDAEFRSAYTPELLAAVAGLLAETGAPVVDARDWVPDDEFCDGHHLTPAGATRFTRRLAAALESAGGPMR